MAGQQWRIKRHDRGDWTVEKLEKSPYDGLAYIIFTLIMKALLGVLIAFTWNEIGYGTALSYWQGICIAYLIWAVCRSR